MILLEMLVEESLSTYYSLSGAQMCTYKLSAVWKDVGLLKYVYPKELISLLEKLLEANP